MKNHGTANLGQFAEIITAITKALPKAIMGFDIKKLLQVMQSGKILEEALLKMFQSLISVIIDSRTFTVIVDYSQSLAQMIVNGNYDEVEPHINISFFPIDGIGEKRIQIFLLSFNYPMDLFKVITEMKSAGFRPVNAAELLALGTQYPKLQQEFPIVELGTIMSKKEKEGLKFTPREFRKSTCLNSISSSDHGLMLTYDELKRLLCYTLSASLNRRCRFAAVKL